MGNQNRERLGLMQVFVPDLFHKPGTVLYVGAYDRRFFASGALYKAGNEITVLEIWQPFIDKLKASRFAGRCTHIVQGDVTDLGSTELPHNTFDYSVWLHGPEHIEADKLGVALQALEHLTNRVVIATCPWGQFKHGTAYGNPHTRHLSHWYPEDFQKMKYRVACIGPKNKPGSQLQAWKCV